MISPSTSSWRRHGMYLAIAGSVAAEPQIFDHVELSRVELSKVTLSKVTLLCRVELSKVTLSKVNVRVNQRLPAARKEGRSL